MKTELWRLFEAKSALWDSLSALVMGLLMAPWPEPMNVLPLHFSVDAKGEYPPQDHVNKAPFSLRKRCKSNQSSLAWLICHPSPSQHVQSSSVQRPTPPRNDPFKAQPPGMGSLFESQKSPCLHMLNIYSLRLSHVSMFQYPRFIMKILCARGNVLCCEGNIDWRPYTRYLTCLPCLPHLF